MKTKFSFKAISVAAVCLTPLMSYAAVESLQILSAPDEPFYGIVRLSGADAKLAASNPSMVSVIGHIPLNVAVAGQDNYSVVIIKSHKPIPGESQHIIVKVGGTQRGFSIPGVGLATEAKAVEPVKTAVVTHKSQFAQRTTADSSERVLPKVTPGKHYIVKSGDTFYSIVIGIKPERVAAHDVMRAVHSKNKQAFNRGDMSSLKVGARIYIPTAQELQQWLSEAATAPVTSTPHKDDADRQAKIAAEQAAKAEADRQAKIAAEQAAKAEADRQAKLAAEQAAKAEADRQAKIAAEQAAKAEADRQAKLAAEQAAKAEADRQAKLAAEQAAKAEADRQAKLAAEQAAKAEADRQAKLAAEQAAKAEADRQAKLAAEQAAKAEADRQAKLAAEQAAKAEADRQAKIAAAAQAEIDRQATLAAEQAAQAEAELAEQRRAEAILGESTTPAVVTDMPAETSHDASEAVVPPSVAKETELTSPQKVTPTKPSVSPAVAEQSIDDEDAGILSLLMQWAPYMGGALLLLLLGLFLIRRVANRQTPPTLTDTQGNAVVDGIETEEMPPAFEQSQVKQDETKLQSATTEEIAETVVAETETEQTNLDDVWDIEKISTDEDVVEVDIMQDKPQTKKSMFDIDNESADDFDVMAGLELEPVGEGATTESDKSLEKAVDDLGELDFNLDFSQSEDKTAASTTETLDFQTSAKDTVTKPTETSDFTFDFDADSKHVTKSDAGFDFAPSSSAQDIAATDGDFDFDFTQKTTTDSSAVVTEEEEFVYPYEAELAAAQKEAQSSIDEETTQSRRQPSVEDQLAEGKKQQLEFVPLENLDLSLDLGSASNAPADKTTDHEAINFDFSDDVAVPSTSTTESTVMDFDFNDDAQIAAPKSDVTTQEYDFSDMTPAAAPAATEPSVIDFDFSDDTPPQTAPASSAATLEYDFSDMTPAAAPAATEPSVIDFDFSDDTPPQTAPASSATTLEYDFSDITTTTSGEGATATSSTPTGGGAPAADFDFVLEDTPAAPVSAQMTDAQKGTVDNALDFTTSAAAAQSSDALVEATTAAVEQASMDVDSFPWMVKLELARAYIANNDKEGAMETLYDLLEDCAEDHPLYQEAEALLNKLSASA